MKDDAGNRSGRAVEGGRFVDGILIGLGEGQEVLEEEVVAVVEEVGEVEVILPVLVLRYMILTRRSRRSPSLGGYAREGSFCSAA